MSFNEARCPLFGPCALLVYSKLFDKCVLMQQQRDPAANRGDIKLTGAGGERENNTTQMPRSTTVTQMMKLIFNICRESDRARGGC